MLAWLNDALAMENALAVVLKHRITDAKGFPAVEEMDRQHLAETLNHAELVKQGIARLGSTPSTAKSLFATIFGAVQAPMTGLAKDEVVKNCLMDYAAEQFEVASYAALIAAAPERTPMPRTLHPRMELIGGAIDMEGRVLFMSARATNSPSISAVAQ